MTARRARTATLLAAPLAALLLSCSGGSDGAADGGASRSPTASAAPAASDRPEGAARQEEQREPAGADPGATVLDIHGSDTPAAWPSPGPEAVRDAFAGLQATLGDSCGTPGNCEYLLGRVLEELEGLDAAMKADPKGPGHFPEPVAWIAALRKDIGEDRSFANLEAHQDALFGTRDRINAWMQDHPDDYR
ncbi:hypothetical protein V1L54_02130 [Streptomyces sp. TRM 70361]|uniref:hypothetical protein n=1 Tax=Streptomyces sp. TRM 70361 TaxID=3116553 RepID=UPI002E7B90C6|nr:hypothetical protein [Streptomyces sp. TRM 70361]MEE1938226.1 hypothetical protein [Streptomyces sp. TRM 70361]